MKHNHSILTAIAFVALFALIMGSTVVSAEQNAGDDRETEQETSVPNLIGVWKGTNRTISSAKGFKEWEKIITITEQKDSRFKGSFKYSEGVKNFYGIIHPDGETFTWVSEDSNGFNLGRILDDDIISACYVETGADMTTGCAELTRADGKD